MTAKKVQMTAPIKEKLKRDLRSFLQPQKIIIELENEPDHILEIERLTNSESFEMAGLLQNAETNNDFAKVALKTVEEIIIPKVKNWTNDGEDYTSDKETLIKYVDPMFIMQLFSKIQER